MWKASWEGRRWHGDIMLELFPSQWYHLQAYDYLYNLYIGPSPVVVEGRGRGRWRACSPSTRWTSPSWSWRALKRWYRLWLWRQQLQHSVQLPHITGKVVRECVQIENEASDFYYLSYRLHVGWSRSRVQNTFQRCVRTWSARGPGRGTCTSKWKALEEWLRPLALARPFVQTRSAPWWSVISEAQIWKGHRHLLRWFLPGNLQRWYTETVMEGSRWCSLDVEKNRFKPWLHQTPNPDWSTEKGKANCEETPRELSRWLLSHPDVFTL